MPLGRPVEPGNARAAVRVLEAAGLRARPAWHVANVLEQALP